MLGEVVDGLGLGRGLVGGVPAAQLFGAVLGGLLGVHRIAGAHLCQGSVGPFDRVRGLCCAGHAHDVLGNRGALGRGNLSQVRPPDVDVLAEVVGAPRLLDLVLIGDVGLGDGAVAVLLSGGVAVCGEPVLGGDVLLGLGVVGVPGGEFGLRPRRGRAGTGRVDELPARASSSSCRSAAQRSSSVSASAAAWAASVRVSPRPAMIAVRYIFWYVFTP